MSEQPLGTREAGRIAGRHQRTVVAWIRKGLLPAMKMEGERGPYLIMRADLDALLLKLYTPRPYVPDREASDANGSK